MQDNALKELWQIRFLRILNLEKEGFRFYRRLLKENGSLFEGTKAKSVLEQIMREELKHVRIAGALLKLLREKKISLECSLECPKERIGK